MFIKGMIFGKQWFIIKSGSRDDSPPFIVNFILLTHLFYCYHGILSFKEISHNHQVIQTPQPFYSMVISDTGVPLRIPNPKSLAASHRRATSDLPEGES